MSHTQEIVIEPGFRAPRSIHKGVPISQNWMPPNGIVGRKGMTDGARPQPKM
jgi:hypothetical protein